MTGTRYSASGNFFVWFAQNTGGNEGYFAAGYDQAYLTADNGDVTSVLTLDVGGDSSPDILVGTKSPTAGQGTVEIWLSSGGATPVYTRSEILPPGGYIVGDAMGEVADMTLADLDGDTDLDLIVVTSTGTYSGKMHLFENVGSRAPGGYFYHRGAADFADMSLTTVSAADFTGEGFIDIMVGGRPARAVGVSRRS